MGDKIELQVDLFLPGFPSNEENFIEFLYRVRRITENIFKKIKKEICKLVFVFLQFI